ncbi:MAG TPA: TadE/TadG family type IV pilus assembly protein [Actinomycetales bacterium]|nr:TadE/TadG family type IV pilus assembly protein [Actinomycetales bacterium]
MNDDGSAVVDFALVGGLLSVLFLSVLQVGLVVHVRNTLIDCAAQGARFGAVAGRQPSDGLARTHDLVAAELSAGYERRLSEVSAGTVQTSGVQAVEVVVRAPLPVVGLLGPAGQLTVRGHAFAEDQVVVTVDR